MKKFSSISGFNIPEEPKVEVNKEKNNINSIKSKLIELMNDLLKIQSSGSARTELVNSAITISGKEVLADAIVDLIIDQFDSEKVNLLESLKFEMNDWYTIDRKINQINSKSENIDKKLKRKMVAFLELYSDNHDFEIITENYLDRLGSISDIKKRLLVAESLLADENHIDINRSNIKILINKLKNRIG